MADESVPYVAIGEQAKLVKAELLKAAEAVIESGNYILGPKVQEFEQQFAALCKAPEAIGVANGTISLTMIFRGLGISPGDEIITAPNSFIASASAAAVIGIRPVFADIDDDLNINPAAIEAAITSKTKALLPVHLTGRPAKMDEILRIAKKHNLIVIEDAAQAVGAKYKGQPVGSIGDVASFSLHPLKTLYAFGDAGIITTRNKVLGEFLRQARNHGFKNRNECDFFSYNARLDELQAALLLVQLKNLNSWTESRRKLAFRYNAELKSVVKVPVESADEHCIYQTYVIRADRRDQLSDFLVKHGVDVKIHYPIPIHMQRAASDLGYAPQDFPLTLKASQEILSLPLYPTLTEKQQDKVIKLVREFYAG